MTTITSAVDHAPAGTPELRHGDGAAAPDMRLAAAYLAKALATSPADMTVPIVRATYLQLLRGVDANPEAAAILTDAYVNRRSRIELPTMIRAFAAMSTVGGADAVVASLLTAAWARGPGTATAADIVTRFGLFRSSVGDARAAAQLAVVYYTSPDRVSLGDIHQKFDAFRSDLSVAPMPAAMLTEAWANSDYRFDKDVLGRHFYRLRDSTGATDEVAAGLTISYAVTPYQQHRDRLDDIYAEFLAAT